MSKAKATDLLRAHDANVVAAMRAWVTAAVWMMAQALACLPPPDISTAGRFCSA